MDSETAEDYLFNLGQQKVVGLVEDERGTGVQKYGRYSIEIMLAIIFSSGLGFNHERVNSYR